MDPLPAGESRPVKRRRTPLVLPVASLLFGVAMGRVAPLPAAFWGALAVAGLAAAAATFRWSHLRHLTAAGVMVCLLALGGARAWLAEHTVANDDVATYTDLRPILASLRGRIATVPQVHDPAAHLEFGYRPGPRTSFLLSAREVRTGEAWQPVGGLVRVAVHQPDDRLRAGAEVEMMGWLSRPGRPDNPGQPDPAELAGKQGIRSVMRVEASDGVTLRNAGGEAAASRIYWNLRAAASQHLASWGDEQAGALTAAMILGERSTELRTLNRAMQRTGIAHFLSISGLHLGVFLGFFYLLGRLAMLTPRRAAMIVLAVLAAYMLLAEARAPLLRSALMASAVCAATIFRRQADMLNALWLAAGVLVAADPSQLFDAGFQLSFTIVAALILLERPMRQLLFGRFLRRRGLMVFRDEHRFARWLHYSAANWTTRAVSIALVAWAVAGPLAAYHFGLVGPYAPLLSLLLLPLVAAVIVPGYVSLALAWPMPNLAWQFGRLSAWAADGLGWCADRLALLPGSSLEMRPVGGLWVLLCLGLVGLVLLGRRWRLGWAGIAACAVALAGLTVWTQRPAPAPARAELHLLAVGNGQCILLRTPSGVTHMFDAGTRSGFDAYGATLGPFLRDRRLPSPRLATVSHANSDHYNALPGLLAAPSGGLARLYVNDYFARASAPPRGEGDAQRFFEKAQASGAAVARLRAGDRVRLDDRTEVEVLWPPAAWRDDLATDPNESSLVLRVTCDGRSVLLPGDIGTIAMRELLTRPDKLRCDVLVLPHHGGWARAGAGEHPLIAFVRATGAQVVLLSRAGEPHVPDSAEPQRREFFGRIRGDFRYCSTSRNGWICVRFGRDGLNVETMR